jgi:hypothetical protein
MAVSDGQIQFIHDKVFIEVGHGDLCHDERALEIFIARLLNYPAFASKIRAMVQPAYSELFRKLSASKGVLLDKALLEGILQSSVLADLSKEASVTVWIHNWTKETFDPPADYELDWTASFDRASAACHRPRCGTTTSFLNSTPFARRSWLPVPFAPSSFAANVPCPPGSRLGPPFPP